MLNVFRMFARMRGQRLTIKNDGEIPLEEMLRSGVRARPDVAALASLDQRTVSVLVWHYHDDDVPGPEAEVTLMFDQLPTIHGEARLEHFRIDENHSNAFAAWKRLGSPPAPTPEQYAQLERAGQLAALEPPKSIRVESNQTVVKFKLPRQAVSLLQLRW